ncbi:MAG TPA: 50S ribosomal protein L4 [Candidatus Aminicenantes bacterium]|nr:50S ribosomal protein L4 [Candidatus Aminicenantes bacterium]HRY65501.1 50S ribosomal protein L4 [Candidatus Aminicenantes bacterium]HRZ72031.1 50S ribosomal protein L4 [Candidatus Aminicenantes bacterium]
MAKLDIIDRSGRTAAQVDLPDGVFAGPAKDHLIYEAVVNYRANQRQGTAATKTRTAVSGGGKKPWRQKGTGRARVGSTRSPLWRKGGTVFGPQPRDYSYELPKKARRGALAAALAQKHAAGELLIASDLEVKEPKTKEAVALLKAYNLDSALLVDTPENAHLFRAARNLPRVKAVDVAGLNIYDVLAHKSVVFSRRAFEAVLEKLS